MKDGCACGLRIARFSQPASSGGRSVGEVLLDLHGCPGGESREARVVVRRWQWWGCRSSICKLPTGSAMSRWKSRGVFWLPFVRKLRTPSKRNPSPRGRSILHKRWRKDPPENHEPLSPYLLFGCQKGLSHESSGGGSAPCGRKNRGWARRHRKCGAGRGFRLWICRTCDGWRITPDHSAG